MPARARGIVEQVIGEPLCGDTSFVTTFAERISASPRLWRVGLQVMFGPGKNCLACWRPKLQVWPKFKLALAKDEWVIYPFFALLIVIFFLLLPGAYDYP